MLLEYVIAHESRNKTIASKSARNKRSRLKTIAFLRPAHVRTREIKLIISDEKNRRTPIVCEISKTVYH